MSYLVGKGFKQITIPSYVCGSLLHVIAKSSLNVKYYKINSEFLPNENFLNSNKDTPEDVILFINYFGLINFLHYVKKYLKNYRGYVIVDNAHGSFDKINYLENNSGIDAVITCPYKKHISAEFSYLFTKEPLNLINPLVNTNKDTGFRKGRNPIFSCVKNYLAGLLNIKTHLFGKNEQYNLDKWKFPIHQVFNDSLKYDDIMQRRQFYLDIKMALNNSNFVFKIPNIDKDVNPWAIPIFTKTNWLRNTAVVFSNLLGLNGFVWPTKCRFLTEMDIVSIKNLVALEIPRTKLGRKYSLFIIKSLCKTTNLFSKNLV